MVTDITEIKDPSLTLVFNDRYLIGTDFQLKGTIATDAWPDVLNWFSGDPYPSEADMVTWENERLAFVAIADETKNNQQGLREKIGFAVAFSLEIRTVFNAVLEETEQQTDLTTRYANIQPLLELQPSPFKNRFKTDLLVEMGVDASAIVTDDEKSAYLRYLRFWIQGLTILLAIA